MRACQWALLLPPLAGLLLLMAYPVPHKYNAGGTFPQTATVLGFTIGMTTGSCLLQLVACDPSSDGTCLLGLPRVPAMACQVEAGDGGQNFRSGGEYDLTVHSFTLPSLRSQSKCMWAIILRTCLGILCTLGVRVVLNLLYVKFFRSQLTGDFPSWSLFRPRLSSAALSILRGANHSYNPSVGEAEMHLASLVESVPLAASGTPVNIGDKGSSHSSRSSVSDLAAPQPSPDDHNHHQHQQSKQRKGKRGRRNMNNSHSETESASSRSDSSSSAQQQELAAAAAAAVLSPSTGSVYGKYESAVMWNYVSNMVVGFTLAFVSPIVVSVFGG